MTNLALLAVHFNFSVLVAQALCEPEEQGMHLVAGIPEVPHHFRPVSLSGLQLFLQVDHKKSH